MRFGKYEHFADISPAAYELTRKKEIAKRNIQNMLSKTDFANEIADEKLPNVVTQHSSHMIKRGAGVDPETQTNKAVNIAIANKSLNMLLIKPGETFTFWGRVGHATKKRGFKEGRVLQGDRLVVGTGGGLCNLANTIHYMVLHTPLDVTEFHSHSDALAPDEGERKPFANGTSVCYNSVDYRFTNNTDQTFQLLLWCDGDELCGEIRSEREVPYSYRLVEEGHHFHKEGEKFYRISKIYRETVDKSSGETVDKKLVLNNHSEVMYDYSLIPQELIK